MIQFSSETDQHFTPPEIVAIAKRVMGHIDLDPCSSEAVNEWSVKAPWIFTAEGIEQINGLLLTQGAKVWCNPPGGKVGNKSQCLMFLEALYDQWLTGNVEQFFFLFFNREFIGGTEEINLEHIPRLNFFKRLHYYAYEQFAGEFRQGNWSRVGKGGHYIKKSESTDYWLVIDSDGVVLEKVATKKEAIAFCGGNYCHWTSSPTHPSTLMYFPPRTNSGWTEQVGKLKEATPSDLGHWVIPQFPTDLQAK